MLGVPSASRRSSKTATRGYHCAISYSVSPHVPIRRPRSPSHVRHLEAPLDLNARRIFAAIGEGSPMHAEVRPSPVARGAVSVESVASPCEPRRQALPRLLLQLRILPVDAEPRDLHPVRDVGHLLIARDIGRVDVLVEAHDDRAHGRVAVVVQHDRFAPGEPRGGGIEPRVDRVVGPELPVVAPGTPSGVARAGGHGATDGLVSGNVAAIGRVGDCAASDAGRSSAQDTIPNALDTCTLSLM